MVNGQGAVGSMTQLASWTVSRYYFPAKNSTSGRPKRVWALHAEPALAHKLPIHRAEEPQRSIP